MSKNSLKNKKIVISCLFVFLILGSIIFFVGNKNKQVSNDNNTSKGEEKQKSEYLYHIQYLDEAGSLIAINITKDWKIKYLTIEKAGEKTEQLNDLLKNTKYKNGLELNGKEKETIKNALANLDYKLPLNTKTTLRENEYKIVSYEIGLIAKKEEENQEISFILKALAKQDRNYLSILHTKESINKLKEEHELELLDSYSSKLNDLYEKTRIKKEITTIPDYYENEKFTNDTIITLTLENGVRSTEKEIYDNALKENITYLEYDRQDFDRRAKELWGETITYLPEKYSGVMHCEGYSYNKEKATFEKYFNSSCGEENEVISELAFAYETKKTLVIIEKSLFLNYGPKEAGIYNNKKENIVLYLFVNEDELENAYKNKNSYLQKYSDLATYYSYTFNKNEDGTYTLSTFERLKSE